MCDIRNLATHIEGSPWDYHYEPVNVFTHGKPSAIFKEAGGAGAGAGE